MVALGERRLGAVLQSRCTGFGRRGRKGHVQAIAPFTGGQDYSNSSVSVVSGAILGCQGQDDGWRSKGMMPSGFPLCPRPFVPSGLRFHLLVVWRLITKCPGKERKERTGFFVTLVARMSQVEHRFRALPS